MADSRVTVRCWSDEEFAASAAVWQEILQRSDADPLFMSWRWQWSWWRHHAQLLQAQLHLLAAYSADGVLIGLAPMTLRRVRHRGGMQAMRLETLGSAWRHGGTVFSEYLDFIVDRTRVGEVLAAFEGSLAEDCRWDDLIIGYTKRSGTAQRLAASALGRRAYVRTTDPLEAHAAALPECFDDYLRALDAGTRRKLWNHRKKLVAPALIFAQADQIGEYLDLIDSCHQARWGSPQYRGVTRDFHLEFANAMATADSLRFSQLTVEREPISVMYNIRVGAKEYNLQLGFDPGKIAGISPGYLHFGFSLELACAQGIRLFDFLAGQGRARQYKEDFKTRGEELICLQLVRSASLGWLYRLYDRWKAMRPRSTATGGELTVTGGHTGG